MPTHILIAIDGTDSKEWLDDFGSNSYVYRFYADFKTNRENKLWLHGPDLSGLNATSVLRDAKVWLDQRLKQLIPALKPIGMYELFCLPHRRSIKIEQNLFDDIEFCLVGHSRGAAMVAELAAELPKTVKFLGLYDSVARSPQIRSSPITNVKLTYHARRHPDMQSRNTFGYENITVKGELERTNQAQMYKIADGEYYCSFFRTSHGGIGGDYVASPTSTMADHSGSTTHFIAPTDCFTTKGCTSALNETWGKRNPQAARSRLDLFLRESQEANKFIRNGAKSIQLPLD
ncbi:MAG: hypothetical protein RLZZ628_998 [Bacteroidota bacterium]